MQITSKICGTVQIVDIKILEWKCEPFTSYHQYRYSPHCPLNICYDKENLFDNQELLNLVVKGLPFTPSHQYLYSPQCFLYIFLSADKENSFNSQEL